MSRAHGVGAMFQRVTCTSLCAICHAQIRDGIMIVPAFVIICDECANVLGDMADDASAPETIRAERREGK